MKITILVVYYYKNETGFNYGWNFSHSYLLNYGNDYVRS